MAKTKAPEYHTEDQHKAAAAHIATVAHHHQDFALRYWGWLDGGQIGPQPPRDVGEENASSIQHALNQISCNPNPVV